MKLPRPAILHLGLLAALVATVLAVTYRYVSFERWFYYWDHAAYQRIATRLCAAFGVSLQEGWRALQASYREDYNAVFALPLVPWLRLAGPSRVSYETALALVYLAPLPLAFGAVAAQLVPARRSVAFWATAWLTLLTPMAWVPTLRGFPDTGATVLVTLATYVYLRDLRLERPATVMLVGTLLGFSVVFRRHFGYAALAFLLSACLLVLVRTAARRTPARLDLGRAASALARPAMVAVVGVAVACLVAWTYVRRLAAYDLTALHSSYQEPLSALLRWYLTPFGWASWVMAILGLLWGSFSPTVDRTRLAFVQVFAAVSAGLWLFWVRQVGEQYTLHFTPAVALGGFLFCWLVYERGPRRWRALAVGALACVLLANTVLGLSYRNHKLPFGTRALFAARWAPQVRDDYYLMCSLLRALRREAQPGDAVYVVASSDCLNPDIVRSADEAFRGGAPPLNVLSVPEVDSLGAYPLGELLQAQFVVLADPFQHHLPAGEQDVVRAGYDAFHGGWEIARAFTPLFHGFELETCSVSLWQRTAPTSLADALATLRRVQARLGARPAMQPEWVTVESAFPSWLTRNADGSATWIAHPTVSRAKPGTTVAALAAPVDRAEVLGSVRFVDGRCRGATLAFSSLDSGGSWQTLAEVHRRPGEDGGFRAVVETHGIDRLFLRLLSYSEGSSIDYCLLRVDPLVLRPL
ncbi:MAG TPA: hypothetical protein VMX54_05645 [Vicinamibacteria bacterium]|nr:hypothetical protein [Vicinamibacteria bacterium]